MFFSHFRLIQAMNMLWSVDDEEKSTTRMNKRKREEEPSLARKLIRGLVSKLPSILPSAGCLDTFWTTDDMHKVDDKDDGCIAHPIQPHKKITPSYKRGEPVQIGFGGCGGFYNYLLGVASVIQEHFDLTSAIFSGSSAGCFPALVLALGIDVKTFFHEPNMTLIRDAKRKTYHGLGKWIPLTKEHMLRNLAPDAYKVADKRFYCSVTKVPSLKNELITSWTSNEDMIDCMLTSGHVPLYHPDMVKDFRGEKYIDGSVSNNSPIPHGDEFPFHVFQIRAWREIWPHWILVSTNTDWAYEQFQMGRCDALAHMHELEAILYYKEDNVKNNSSGDEEDAVQEDTATTTASEPAPERKAETTASAESKQVDNATTTATTEFIPVNSATTASTELENKSTMNASTPVFTFGKAPSAAPSTSSNSQFSWGSLSTNESSMPNFEEILMNRVGTPSICISSYRRMVEQLRKDQSNDGEFTSEIMKMCLKVEEKITKSIDHLHAQEEFCRQQENIFYKTRENAPKTIKINVGGKIFETSKDNLLKDTDNFFSMMVSSNTYKPRECDGAYFIDGNYEYFDRVMTYLRCGVLDLENVNDAAKSQLKYTLQLLGMESIMSVHMPKPEPEKNSSKGRSDRSNQTGFSFRDGSSNSFPGYPNSNPFKRTTSTSEGSTSTFGGSSNSGFGFGPPPWASSPQPPQTYPGPFSFGVAPAPAPQTPEVTKTQSPKVPETEFDKAINGIRKKDEERRKALKKILKKYQTTYVLVGNDILKAKKVMDRWQALEKLLDAQAKLAESTIRLNVGGTIFETAKSTLVKFPGTYFHAMLSNDSWSPRADDGAYFIDLDSKYFEYALDALRQGKLNTTGLSHFSKQQLQTILNYLQMESLPTVYGCNSTSNDSDDNEEVQYCTSSESDDDEISASIEFKRINVFNWRLVICLALNHIWTMSFNFGSGTTGTSTGFSFGNTASTDNKAGSSGGFSFGGAAASTPAPASSSGFSFGASTAAPAATSSGFSFGGSNPVAASTTPAAPASTEFQFGATTASTPAATTTPSTGFSFGGSTTPAATTTTEAKPASGFAFGGSSTPAATTTPVTTTPASTGFSFGGSTSTPAASTSTTTPASTGFSFGATPAATTTTTPATTTPSTSGFSFGGAATPAASTTKPASTGFSFGNSTTPAATTTDAAKPTSTGFSFGASSTPAATPAATTPTTTTTPSTTGFSFGDAAKTTTTPAATTSDPKPATTGFSFGATATTDKPATTPAAGFSFGDSKTSTDTGALSKPATDATTPAPTTAQEQPPAEYLGKTVEDIINMWSEQLENHAMAFTNEAVRVSHWDTELMENQKKLGDLAIDVRRLQMAQKELNANLDTISAYQMELDSTLENLESSVDKLFESHRQIPDTADIEREQGLQLSVDIDNQLNMMSTALKETIDRLNASQSQQDDSDNPMAQILKVLNVHHNSLVWIDGNATKLASDMADIAKKLQQ
ncbi:nuclear pore glycoprotein [Thraustotheca clavata]|uniref:Nuclear pore glycoprotein n=1 Tax=Thraustotheca clavata TaxID=74557 RepID=A0A1V9Z874_9STRA|nr:nuclear pore glycoprotein [Thraustotheca clavata]